MAATVVKILIEQNGSTREISVYNPDTNFLSVDRQLDDTTLTVTVLQMEPIEIQFPSIALLEGFISDLETAILSGSGIVTISNQGPVRFPGPS
jgi:hypothetical protein